MKLLQNPLRKSKLILRSWGTAAQRIRAIVRRKRWGGIKKWLSDESWWCQIPLMCPTLSQWLNCNPAEKRQGRKSRKTVVFEIERTYLTLLPKITAEDGWISTDISSWYFLAIQECSRVPKCQLLPTFGNFWQLVATFDNLSQLLAACGNFRGEYLSKRSETV